MRDLELSGASATVFTAGGGQRYGLVSLAGSDGVTVFKKVDEKWYGHVSFDRAESSGLAPGEAVPEIAALLAANEKEN